jgi:AmmeMemoRadiSam system protein B
MDERRPIVAGQFYPADRDSCVAEIEECLHAESLPADLPDTIVAGIVPHAGWTFSGPLAAMVFATVKHQHEKVDTFVVFGAAHSYVRGLPAMWDKGTWQTPLGTVDIDEELALSILETQTARSDYYPHTTEHSIEVQIPFIRQLFPQAKILPIVVPPDENALALGHSIGDIVAAGDKTIVCIGSTDLTHYGPRYGFAPMGVGEKAVKWASETNDRQFIDLALKLDAAALLENAAQNCNACGPGAAAAVLCAASKQGKTEGRLLAHTNSNEIMLRKMAAASADSVGYAAIIY